MNGIFSIRRHTAFLAVLTLAVFLETFSYTYMQQEGRILYYTSSLVYFICGLLVAIIPVIYVRHIPENSSSTVKPNRLAGILYYIFLIGLLGYHIFILATVYKGFRISTAYADMIPNIQVACHRFLTGQLVYSQVPEIKTNPNYIVPYLPVMWMSYLPSEIFHFDPRWCSLAVAFIPLFVIVTPLFKQNSRGNFLVLILACGSLFLYFNYFLMKYVGFWAMTEEAITAGFYMLLGFSLLRRKYIATGILIICALLTRPVLIFWIPAYFAFIFFTRPRGDFIKLFLSFTISLLALFVLPFFIRDPHYFFNLPGDYIGEFNEFWQRLGLDDKRFLNIGLFKFFSNAQINLMIQLQIITGFLAPAIFLFIIGCVQKTKPEFNNRYVAFASLKLSLVFVYNFLGCPYIYVFFPAGLISYVVLFDFLGYKQPVQSEPPGETFSVVLAAK